MTQEDKLVLKDLSARWFYGVIVSVTDGTIKYNAYIESVSYKNIQVSPVSDSNFTAYTFYKISEIKPYLRSMEDMTEEEKIDYQAFFNYDGVEYPEEYIDWLNKNMFDYRGLIPRGLAIKVTKENNPYKNNYDKN